MSAERPTVAVLTLAHGRHDHLAAQAEALAAGTRRPDHYVVAAIDDAGVAAVVGSSAMAGREVVVDVPRSGAHLPLAAARNAAAQAAITLGAQVLVLLDVDCLPSRRLVERYTEACRRTLAEPRPTVYAGAVNYLAPRPAGQRGYSRDDLARSTSHPARGIPAGQGEDRVGDPRLLWSLSMATGATHWQAVGGFDEGYVGYGGEDTDYGMRLVAAGGRLVWVGGAVAYHQYHEIEDPPRRHVADIVRNANRFFSRWGWFPMEGWLAAFQAEGLVRLDAQRPSWVLTAAADSAVRTG